MAAVRGSPRLTHLADDPRYWLGPQLGLLVQYLLVAFLCGLGFLTAWWLDCKSEHSKRHDVEAASFLKPEPRS